MSGHRTLTELAIHKRRVAASLRKQNAEQPLALLKRDAQAMEREADDILALDGPPDVGTGGEVVNPQMTGVSRKQRLIRDTLAEGPDRIAEEASLRRTDLLMQPSFNALPLGIDAAESIEASNSLEKMLAHQMAVTHEATMRLMDRALSYDAGGRGMREGDSVEACRLANTAARLMSVYQEGLLTLHRIRNGGNQTVTVQHLSVAPGAQAVVGNVSTGGHKRRGSRSKNQ